MHLRGVLCGALGFGMTADAAIYKSERTAIAYAFTRPPVHRHIVERIRRHLPRAQSTNCALDIGCGAGASTAALTPLAEKVVGIERYALMLKHVETVAPRAEFYVGRAEALPFASHSFDLVTAAGVLNYTDVDASLSEVERVLSVHGIFIPYDFSTGRRLREDPRLCEWHKEFGQRFPYPPGYELDLEALNYDKHNLALFEYEEFEVGIPMPLVEYVNYMMGEAGVDNALLLGENESEIRRYIRDGLQAIFSESSREVIFEAQIAYVRKSCVSA